MAANNVQYPGLGDYVSGAILRGDDPADVYEVAKADYNYTYSLAQFRKYYSYIKNRDLKKQQAGQFSTTNGNGVRRKADSADVTEEELHETIFTLLKQRDLVDIFDLCEELECYPNVIANFIHSYREKGFEIIWQDNQIWLSERLVSNPDAEDIPQLGDTEVVFGVCSDLHFGSRAVQITAMHEFAEICKKEGAKHMLCAGDITAGFKVYPGQEMEVYTPSSEHQEESCLVNLPKGLHWYLLGGNHDYAFIKRGGGHNIIRSIANQREDITYCGFDLAEIPILNGVNAQLWHPSGGVPYSVSYRLQKGVEQIAFDELIKIVEGTKKKPTVRFVFAGHLHIQLQALFGSILGMQVGCFEGTTNYLKAKRLVPAIGGYVVKACLDKDGELKNWECRFHRFREIIADWKNYKHTIDKDEKIKTPILG